MSSLKGKSQEQNIFNNVAIKSDVIIVRKNNVIAVRKLKKNKSVIRRSPSSPVNG